MRAISKDLVELVEKTESVAICEFTEPKLYIIKIDGKYITLNSNEIISFNQFKKKYLSNFNKTINITNKEYEEYISNLLSADNPHIKKITNLFDYVNSEYKNVSLG